jgi:hypothetical protein
MSSIGGHSSSLYKTSMFLFFFPGLCFDAIIGLLSCKLSMPCILMLIMGWLRLVVLMPVLTTTASLCRRTRERKRMTTTRRTTKMGCFVTWVLRLINLVGKDCGVCLNC